MINLQTFSYRIKNPKHLSDKAKSVNLVWNYLCEIQRKTQHDRRKWLSHFDFNRLLTGISKSFKLHTGTLSEIARYFVQSRDKIKKCPRWRSNKKSLGWVPFIYNGLEAKEFNKDLIKYLKVYYPIWADRPLEGKIKSGSFSQDSRGRWYINIVCEVEPKPKEKPTNKIIGIDLGVKDLAILSNGTKIENPKHYKSYEQKLATAQRSGNKKRVKAIHVKIHNKRKNDLHLISNKLINNFDEIYIGNASSSRLAQIPKMGKGINDAGWGMLKNMLRYKTIRHVIYFAEVNEAYSTQTCSTCGAITGPKGKAGLGVREWTCSECNTFHDRDINAAKNILIQGKLSGCRASLQQTQDSKLSMITRR